MTQLSPEQQEALNKQKEQCPFCKIVKGEIPSKKVYEDDLIIAVLDINPASNGHILVMPKEHYPIMPLIPKNEFEHLFFKTKELSMCIKEAMLTFGNTIFIANGFAAGQQSNHFMLHIVPREENDDLDNFMLKKVDVDGAKLEEAFKVLSNNLPLMLKKNLGESGKQPSGVAYSKDELINLVEQNPQLKTLITTKPEEFKQQIVMNPQLKALFEKVDVDEIISHFNPTAEVKEEVKVASFDELKAILDTNPMIKDMLMNDPIEFKQKIEEVPQLKQIFGGVDLDQLRERLGAKKDDVIEALSGKEEEQVVDTNVSEDDVLKELMGGDEEGNADEDDVKEEKEKSEETKDEKEEVVEDKPSHGDPSLDNISTLFR